MGETSCMGGEGHPRDRRKTESLRTGKSLSRGGKNPSNGNLHEEERGPYIHRQGDLSQCRRKDSKFSGGRGSWLDLRAQHPKKWVESLFSLAAALRQIPGTRRKK